MITLEKARQMQAHLSELQANINVVAKQASELGLNVNIQTVEVTSLGSAHCDFVDISVTVPLDLIEASL